MVGRGKKKFIGLANDYRRIKEEYIILIKEALQRSPISFRKEKIWLVILVVKPNMRMDAINYLDGLADAVKAAIGIDDRYYAAVIDYMLDPIEPRIELKVGHGRSVGGESKSG